MADNNPQPLSRLAIILGGVMLVALALFISTGGDLGGTKKVESDADLPKVTSPPPSSGSETTGTRGVR